MATTTNETTRNILDFLLNSRHFAWRENVLPVPVQRKGVVVGFRSGGKSGISDIVGVLSPEGRSLFVEIKTGKDKLRPVQKAFLDQAKSCGALVMIVKDFNDFLEQWKMMNL